MIKKSLSVLLVLIMVLTALPLTALDSFAEDEILTSGDWDYSIGWEYSTNSYNREYYAIIEKYNGNDVNVIVPSEIDGYEVRSIGGETFYNNTKVKSIEFSSGIRRIMSKTILLDVIHYEGWESVDYNFCYRGAFENCTSLTSVILPDGLLSIGPNAFKGSSLKSITLPSSIENAGSNYYSYSFGDEDYYGTNNSGFGAFFESNIETAVFEAGTKTIPTYIFKNCNSLRNVTIPESVECINSYAFLGCSNLEQISLPNGLKTIGGGAFIGCTSLGIITLPSSVTSIEGAFFSDNAKINVSSIGTWISIYDNDPQEVGGYSYELYLNNEIVKDLVIPNGTTKIGHTFRNCKSIESITIPSSVTSITYRAFEGCNSLKAVYISSLERWLNINFMDIGEYDYGVVNPLYLAHNLYLNGNLVTDLVIPDGVARIPKWAFVGCTSIKNVTIPEGVTVIDNYAFGSCSSIETVTVPNSVTEIGYSFGGCSSLENINISSIESWCNIDNWWGIGCSYNLCLNGSVLKNLNIPNGVETINKNAFNGCKSINSVTVPGTVKNIGESSFSNCTSLSAVNLENGVKTIGSQAFGNTALTSLTLPSGLESIGNSILSGNTGVTSITIPKSFCDCCITQIDEGWTNIVYNTPFKDSNIQSCTFEPGTTEIPISVFNGCGTLSSVTIPDSVTRIKDYAFANCTSLSEITIPKSVINISNNAFSNCSNLIIYGYKNSVAQTFAVTNGFDFVQLDDDCEHENKEWVITKKASYDELGERVLVCSECGEEIYREEIPKLVKNGWFTENGNKVYYANGVMYKSKLATIDGKKYYFGSNGAMYKNKLISVSGNKYYMGKDGVAYKSKLATIDGKKYYFGSNCVAYKSKFASLSGKKYYFGSDCAMVKSKLISVSGKKYYLGTDGVMVKSKLITYNSKKYYLGSDGVAYKSKLASVSGKKYYFGKDGAAYQSKFGSISGKKYYFGSNGIAYKSKFASISGKKYYFGSDCVMYKSKTFSVSGVKWKADSKGVCKKV